MSFSYLFIPKKKNCQQKFVFVMFLAGDPHSDLLNQKMPIWQMKSGLGPKAGWTHQLMAF